jgi:hypothetical protein
MTINERVRRVHVCQKKIVSTVGPTFAMFLITKVQLSLCDRCYDFKNIFAKKICRFM